MKLTMFEVFRPTLDRLLLVLVLFSITSTSLARPLSSVHQHAPSRIFKRDSYQDTSCTSGDYTDIYNTANTDALALVNTISRDTQ